MRQPAEWTTDDLRLLITNQVQESLTLDYKESASLQRQDARKNEISKDVSAFANSAGGVIVYGIREDGHFPTGIDEGVDPNEIGKEWLEQVINSRIQRRIDAVTLNQVSLSQTQPLRVAYVVVIPPSARAPHMAFDRRYYKRFNFESVPMEDYELRDVSRRLSSPRLQIGALPLQPVDTPANKLRSEFQIFIENHAPAAAEFALLTLFVPVLNNCIVEGMMQGPDSIVAHGGTLHPVRSFKLEWRGGLRLPIMQGTKFFVAKVSANLTPSLSFAHIFWEVLCSTSEPARGIAVLRHEPSQLLLETDNTSWALASPLVWSV